MVHTASVAGAPPILSDPLPWLYLGSFRHRVVGPRTWGLASACFPCSLCRTLALRFSDTSPLTCLHIEKMILYLVVRMVAVWPSYRALVKALDLKAASFVAREEHRVDSWPKCCQWLV